MNQKITNSGEAYALSRRVQRDIPEHWGKSDLTQFLGLMEANAIATFAGRPKWFEALERIDKTLVANSSNLFHQPRGTQVTAARLYMRAFGAYRAAVRLAVSGQVYETSVLRRSIVEHAVYAWVCGHSQTHRDAWIARANGEPERKTAKRAFQWTGLMQLLATVDQGLAEEIGSHYDDSIDFGAHPNVEGVDLSSQVLKAEGEAATLNTIFAHGPDAIVLAITDIINTMQLVYRLLLHSFGDRMRVLSIDQHFTADARYFVTLFEEQRRELANREGAKKFEET
jgi:hypothetical protein